MKMITLSNSSHEYLLQQIISYVCLFLINNFVCASGITDKGQIFCKTGSQDGQVSYAPDFHTGCHGLTPTRDNLPPKNLKPPCVPDMTMSGRAYSKMFKKERFDDMTWHWSPKSQIPNSKSDALTLRPL